MSEFDMYLITRLDCLKAVCIVLSVFSTIAFVSLMLESYEWYVNKEKEAMYRRYAKIAFGVMLFGIAGSMFMPTTKEYAMIKVVPKIVNSKMIGAESSELYKLLKDYMKQEIKENK